MCESARKLKFNERGTMEIRILLWDIFKVKYFFACADPPNNRQSFWTLKPLGSEDINEVIVDNKIISSFIRSHVGKFLAKYLFLIANYYEIIFPSFLSLMCYPLAQIDDSSS